MSDFLYHNFCEDKMGRFRVQYSPEKLKWAIGTPGFKRELFIVLRNSKNKKIMAFGTGDIKKAIICGKTCKLTEGNFLCVH